MTGPLGAKDDFGQKLREKWREIPATRQERQFSSDLLILPDDQLLAYWEECRRQTSTPDVRGWFQERYAARFSGARLADIGPGVGVDGIWFAQHGAHVTFADIVEGNLQLLRRLCELKDIDAEYYYIDDFFQYRFSAPFDCFLCVGSLINAPFDFTQRQVAALTPFLRVGGTVLMLGYPHERFEQLGASDGAEFGRMTDGERTPWAEWYDAAKVERLFGPNFRLEFTRNLGHQNIEFNWFELTRLA
jgi:hypothetical protein